jgi:polyisoprenoid-binding protein YceI
MKQIPLLVLIMALFMNVSAQAQSTIKFRIKNAGFTTYGSFSDFSTEVQYDKNNPAKSKFTGTVKVKSVNTENSSRDAHLRKADFFDVDKYPTMKFESTEVSAVSTSKLNVKGNLTIKGVTKKVTFVTDIGSKSGKTSFTTSLYINRLDYGVGTSSWTLANDLYIDLYIEK